MTTTELQIAGKKSNGALANHRRQQEARVMATRWVDLCAPGEAEFTILDQEFHFHPLAIEDCRHFNQRSKVEAYDGYLFISLTRPLFTVGQEEMEAEEIQVFLGPDYLVTVHDRPSSIIDQVRVRYAQEERSSRCSPDFVLHTLADLLVDSYFPILEEIEDEIDRLEDDVLVSLSQKTISRIFALKQTLIYLRKLAGPLREVMNTLSSQRFPLISEPAAFYFRDLYDHLVRIYEMIETSRDLLSNVLDAYLSTVNNRLSEVMKRLTLVATVFMPLSFIVGFGGMNFTQIPFDQLWAFIFVLFTLVVSALVLLVWYWRSRWV